jgi:hypothetical protein
MVGGHVIEVKRTPFGFHMTFSGHITSEEMLAWKVSAVACLGDPTLPKPFRVRVDMTSLEHLDVDPREILVDGQASFRDAGMDRSVVVIAERSVGLQMRDTALASGIETGERYIHIEEPRWRMEANDWLLRGIEPSHR